MNKKEQLNRIMSKLGDRKEYFLRTLIVLLMINYMIVTIILQDFILLKFMRDFILIVFFAVTLWKKKPVLFPGLILLLFFVLTCIPGVLQSVSISLSFTVLRRYLFPLLLFFSVYQLNSSGRLQVFSRFILWLFAILSLWGIFQAHVLGDQFLIGLGYPTQFAPQYQREALYNSYYFGGFGIQRVVATLSNSNVYGLILGCTLIFLAFGYTHLKEKKYALPLLAIIAIGYVLTFSRSNFLAMAVVIVLFAFPYIPHKKPLLIALACLAGTFVIIGLILGEGSLVYKLLLWVRDSFTFKESSAAGRTGRWLAALSTVLKHPFGIGFGHVGSIASEAGVTEGYYSCENSFLATALDTGWLGMIFYYSFVGIQAWQLRRYAHLFRKNSNKEQERLCMSGFVIVLYFLIVFFFSNHIYDMEAVAVIYVYIALLLSNVNATVSAISQDPPTGGLLDKISNKIYMLLGNIFTAICSLFWKRRRDTVLFGAWFGDKFADNSRFLYQYLAENKESLGLNHVVWVTRNQAVLDMLRSMGYEAYLTDSAESVHFHKTAFMHVVCNSTSNKNGTVPDIDIRYSFGAKRVNLWHGVGVVKGVGCASKEYQCRKAQHKLVYTVKELLERSFLYRQFVTGIGGWGNFYFLSPTEADTKQFREFSYIPEKHFIQTQYPRTCTCPRLTETEAQVLEIIKQTKNTVLYLPTFRTGSNTFDFSKLAEQLLDVLAEKDILWIQKAHSASSTTLSDASTGHILNLPPEFDINTIMPYISMLVTDYSSAASDARFFHKPVLFYVPDLEDYANGDNGVTEEAEELMRGPHFFDIDSLKAGLATYIIEPDSAKPEDYCAIREKYWGEEMDISRIWQDILSATKTS